ncbi:MAG: hypothetical protein R2751_14680 [Bacteroidales bacterium]
MMSILEAFAVPRKSYKPVLFWGVLGAIVMRFGFIFAGAALISRFEWLLYIFGGYLLYAGVKMYLDRNKKAQVSAQDHPLVRFMSRKFRVYPRYVKDHFFIRKNGLRYITPCSSWW